MSVKLFGFNVPVGRTILVVLFVVIAGTAGVTLQVLQQLPDVELISSYVPSESTILYSADDKILARFHQEENRQVVPLSQISPYFIKAVIATEDPNFYKHHGLDFLGIARAAVKNFAYGRVVEGGSTLTQQLAKNLFLTKKKVLTRKLAEAILAVQMERRYTKEEILEMYLNQVYLGHNSYGIESAAMLYFNKHASDLTLAESAMVAGIIHGPELYSPYRNLKGAKLRQIDILNKLIGQRAVSEKEAKLAAAEQLTFYPQNLKMRGEIAPYFISYVLQELTDLYGEDMVYHGGLKVYTTLDTKMQFAAEKAVTDFIKNEGPKFKFSQGALVSIDPATGYIKALVGGADFFESKFNRATQAKRQPGSSFKPFVYIAAIEQGIMPNAIIQDAPTTFKVWVNKWNPKGTWAPKNFDGKYSGAVTMRYALEKSLNIPAVKLLEMVGVPNAINVAQKMGITSNLEPALSLALGASEVTVLEMTSAYGVLANNGVRVEPASILKIESRDGVPLYKNQIQEKRVLDSNVAAIMVDMMRGVITRGTGFRANIGRPAAAKTGTSQDFKDAWFIGFVPQLVTGIWVGNDDNTPMNGVAEVGVCPRIWKAYNTVALQGLPVLDFQRPQGLQTETVILEKKIDAEGSKEGTVPEGDLAPEEVQAAPENAPEGDLAPEEVQGGN